MTVRNLAKEHSIFNEFIAEIRDKKAQSDSMRFRLNMERIGEIFAYEISKTLGFRSREVKTPLGIANTERLQEQPVLATILRAGLPLHSGLLRFFDHASNAFISAYRRHYKDGSFDIAVEYISSPVISKKILILADPMLATGKSMALAYEALLEYGKPLHTHIISVIASTEGIEYIKKKLPDNCTVWTGAIDDELTAEAYIVPGLGDAGDLAYGNKE